MKKVLLALLLCATTLNLVGCDMIENIIGSSSRIKFYKQKEENSFIEIDEDEFVDKVDKELRKREYDGARIDVTYSEEVDLCMQQYAEQMIITCNFIDDLKEYHNYLGLYDHFDLIEPEIYLNQLHYDTYYGRTTQLLTLANPYYVKNVDKYFKEPYAVELDLEAIDSCELNLYNVVITYTDFMLPNTIEAEINDVKVNIKYNYYNEESLSKLKGELSREEYMLYMTSKVGVGFDSLMHPSDLEYKLTASGQIGQKRVIEIIDGRPIITIAPIEGEAVVITKDNEVVWKKGDEQSSANIINLVYRTDFVVPLSEHYIKEKSANVNEKIYYHTYELSGNEIKVFTERKDGRKVECEIEAVFDLDGVIQSFKQQNYIKNAKFEVEIEYYN